MDIVLWIIIAVLVISFGFIILEKIGDKRLISSLSKQVQERGIDSTVKYIGTENGIAIDARKKKICIISSANGNHTFDIWEYRDLLGSNLQDKTQKMISTTDNSVRYKGEIVLQVQINRRSKKKSTFRIDIQKDYQHVEFVDYYAKLGLATLIDTYVKTFVREAQLEKGTSHQADEIASLLTDFKTSAGKKLALIYHNDPLASGEIFVGTSDEYVLLTNERLYLSWERNDIVNSNVLFYSEIKELDFKHTDGWYELRFRLNDDSILHIDTVAHPFYIARLVEFYWTQAKSKSLS